MAGRVFVELFDYFYVALGEIVGAQLERLPQHRIDLHRLAQGRLLAREAQQILND